jgi:hypothetical protein
MVCWCNVGVLRRETGSPVTTFQKMFAYCVVCGMGSRVIALLGGGRFSRFRENAPGDACNS